MDTVNFQLNELNKYLEPYEQRIVLSEQKENEEKYWNLTWFRPADKFNEIEEHIIGGDDFDLFSALTGIKYGIRMNGHVKNH